MRVFNTTGYCNPDRHYTVELTSRLVQIAAMVRSGDWFVIDKAPQYGKTTILKALACYLSKDYDVVGFDFQRFEGLEEELFVRALADGFTKISFVPDDTKEKLLSLKEGDRHCNLRSLFYTLSDWLAVATKPVVLIVDGALEGDKVFQDFLSQLRASYLDRDTTNTFQSVVLAGYCGDWNISAEFQVNMNFSASDIVGMLNDYESDHSTGMDVEAVAEMIYNYTSGYPYLVSWICKYADEHCDTKGWIEESILCAVKDLVESEDPIFEPLVKAVADSHYLTEVSKGIFSDSVTVPHVIHNQDIALADRLGLVCQRDGTVRISNKIFEMVLYNWFSSQP